VFVEDENPIGMQVWDGNFFGNSLRKSSDKKVLQITHKLT
jgi:hypothetical protein